MINCSVGQLLQFAAKRLTQSSSPLLDAQLLLAYVLQTKREILFAWPERQLNYEQLELFTNLLSKREQGEPVAYLTGKQSFWKLELKVSPAVLIPRPETELIVEWVLNYFNQKTCLQLADLGTGSGAIALAIAQERPQWQLTATDFSYEALSIAIQNASHHQIQNIIFKHGDWCQPLESAQYDCIVSNPPYVADTEKHLLSHETCYEPAQALFAKENGFAELLTITKQAKKYLKSGAPLILEHGFQQAKTLRNQLTLLGYQQIVTLPDLAGLDRITIAFC
ncbi:MAG: protein-(glutamine-N5) methyltransferase, release factor-specific [Gammaproteobacteria bacterium RIFCSPHIGHO2_12_FULL_35_23]|nr:MAG: protein-(glutamine-N5) methyltransferase, release factor-specific [Gammaproteobacteria bacterium RIFCSPHIGHO2_12_FULL_35_23]